MPLVEFEAKDGNYFPPFIKNFFKASDDYESRYPSLIVARSDMHLVQVKRLNAGEDLINESNLSWSADGVYLSFETVNSTKRKIQLKNLKGDFSRELAVIPKSRHNFLDGMVSRTIHSYNAGLSWSRDSTQFAFMSNGGVGEYNIYVGAIGEKEKSIAKSSAKDGYANWSPQKNEISFVSSRTGNGDLYLLSIDDNELFKLSDGEMVDIFPDWFPDGSKLVYSSGDALNHDLLVIERDKEEGQWKKPWKLTDWNRDELRPKVSPDGRLIAFYANQKFGDQKVWNIYVVPYKKGKTYTAKELSRRIVARDVVVDLNTGPSWTPDSRKLLYVKRDPKSFNPIHGYDLFTGRKYVFNTGTKMNRDIMVSRLGVLSFRAQVGVWDRVFVALTNQGLQMQKGGSLVPSRLHYVAH